MEQLPSTLEGFKLALEFMGGQLKELKEDFRDFKTNYVPISDYITLKTQVDKNANDLENLKSWRDTSTGRLWGLCATITTIATVAAFAIDHFIK